jgi:1-phosphofructokinase
MITTITFNPAVDKTVEIENFEAGTVNRVSSVRMDAGGKGINVSKVVQSLGGKSRAVGFLGGSTGEFIKESLDRLKLENDFVFVEGETRTNLKIIDSIKKSNTDINEAGPGIYFQDIEKLKKVTFSRVDGNSVVVFSGSVPENVDKGIYGQWITKAKELGAKTILDADRDLLKYGIKAGPYLVKPNIRELEMLFERKIYDVKEAERLARSLIDSYGIEMVVISLGEKGALFLNKKDSILAHGIKVEVKSTVGAGDSMVAALAYAIDKGLDFEKAVRLAVASGTANVMTSGTQPAEYETIIGLEKKVTTEYLTK